VKTFLRRKLRPSIGQILSKERPSNLIYTFLISYNEISTHIMNKYIENINLILNKPVCNTKKTGNLNAFKCNDKYIYNCESREVLCEMLKSEDLTYCTENDLQYIYNKHTPKDFDPKEYKELNDDLKDMTNLEAKYHYEHFGYKENRKYKYENTPKDFI
jgi:hypothetical protein